jgi:hypothetical protein
LSVGTPSIRPKEDDVTVSVTFVNGEVREGDSLGEILEPLFGPYAQVWWVVSPDDAVDGSFRWPWQSDPQTPRRDEPRIGHVAVVPPRPITGEFVGPEQPFVATIQSVSIDGHVITPAQASRFYHGLHRPPPELRLTTDKTLSERLATAAAERAFRKEAISHRARPAPGLGPRL